MLDDNEVLDTHKIVCRPFRETGYCGYGDSCKYSHDRSVEYTESSVVSNAGLLCGICKKPYEEKVVTECGHSFCSLCAIRRYQGGDECGVCGKPVYGKFWVS
ncbi:zinc finger domain-containing protein [Encephalitozoon hellem ATCC 50504]|nr:zinc finger domain-containing protein [Encephalitozoon hellem ATCC 50504]AFM98471.1 zinc finger domain-containing protein [Encephalitozoon hellem ATCC 50504]UTX43396.1 zinc finger domain-containing protein [Encephalitozoon hellem]|eukprot:XP_003887452.1 zinc finger domain-containing protein [Encephalitozoon hellem ATCC 50504]